MAACKKTDLKFPLGQDILQEIRKKGDAQERIRTLVEEKQTQRIFITRGWETSLAGLESSGSLKNKKAKNPKENSVPQKGRWRII